VIEIEIVATAVRQALGYWPLLFVPIGAQLAHELTHFPAARALAASPLIQIRLRTPMRVVYDDAGLSLRADLAIGATPTLAGLTGACVWLWVAGWPAVTPVTVVGVLAWGLYTMPSAGDLSELPPLIDLPKPVPEPHRSLFIGLTAIALGTWLIALPYPQPYTTAATFGVILGALIYTAIAIVEHGAPDPDALA